MTHLKEMIDNQKRYKKKKKKILCMKRLFKLSYSS